jgi:hypothetical protein
MARIVSLEGVRTTRPELSSLCVGFDEASSLSGCVRAVGCDCGVKAQFSGILSGNEDEAQSQRLRVEMASQSTRPLAPLTSPSGS